MAELRAFLSELKRRRVWQVAVVYTVVAWLLIQVAAITLPAFEAPPWALRVFILFVALGFPVAIVLAWALELSPEGVRRTRPAEAGAEAAPAKGRGRLLAAVGIGALLAIVALGGGPAASVW